MYSYGSLKRPLVLILGSPRSGTTWLAKIFDSSERVLYRHEPDSVYRNNKLPHIPEESDISGNIQLAAEYLSESVNVRKLKSSASPPIFPKSYRSVPVDTLRRAFAIGAKALERIFGKVGINAGILLPDFVGSWNSGKFLVVIKSVSSLSQAKLYSAANPRLHIIKHPCAFVSSRLRGSQLQLMEIDTFLDSQAGMAQAKRRGWTLDYIRGLSTEEQLASLWMLQNEKVMEEMSGAPNYKMVVYEDLCNHTSEAVEDLFAFAGLEVTRQTVEFIRSSQSGIAGEEQYYKVVRDSRAAAQKWRGELKKDQIEKILSLVSDSLPGKLFV